MGFVYPNAAALALAPFDTNAGSASSLLGTFQMGLGAVASIGVSALGGASATPMVAIIAGTTVAAMGILIAGGAKAIVPPTTPATAGGSDK
jgi:MFS transporter, DHA1 family, multidrug resistance protein